MTLKVFIRKLQAIEKRYGGNLTVCADTQELRQTCNDAWAIVNVTQIGNERVIQCDGDGGYIENKDGTERTKHCVVLK